MKNLYLYMMPLLCAVCLLAACNKDSDSNSESAYTFSTSKSTVLVDDFSLQANDDVLDNLDSVFFTIDFDNRVIYNADSLPVGTDVSKLLVNILFMNTVKSAVFTITGGKVAGDATIDYTTSSTDSIDFTGDVKLTVTSYDATNVATYDVKVNVHQQEPDSIMWNRGWQSGLPGIGGRVLQSKAVLKDNTIWVWTDNVNDYQVLSKDAGINGGVLQWEEVTTSSQLDFTAKVSTFAASEDALYVLDDEGKLYSSADGVEWTDCGVTWSTIIGGYEDVVLGLIGSGEELMWDMYPRETEPTEIDDDFPITGMSQLMMADNGWSKTRQAMFVGGMTKDGGVSNDVWGFDGFQWTIISDDRYNNLPEVTDAVMFPYYTYYVKPSNFKATRQESWFMLGGIKADGSINKTVYISTDQGISWAVADDEYQLPATVPYSYKGQALVRWEDVTFSDLRVRRRNAPDQPLVSWETPFIYLFGGITNSEWIEVIHRGVLLRMWWDPLY